MDWRAVFLFANSSAPDELGPVYVNRTPSGDKGFFSSRKSSYLEILETNQVAPQDWMVGIARAAGGTNGTAMLDSAKWFPRLNGVVTAQRAIPNSAKVGIPYGSSQNRLSEILRIDIAILAAVKPTSRHSAFRQSKRSIFSRTNLCSHRDLPSWETP
jgi:hypothetical protein